MNTELLRRVRDAIRANPEHFDMEKIVSHGALVFDKTGVSAPCGTTACIAGWAVALTDGVIFGDSLDGINRAVRVANYSLRLPNASAWMELVHASNWPEPFRELYEIAATPYERAYIATEYIDHFIAKHAPTEAVAP